MCLSFQAFSFSSLEDLLCQSTIRLTRDLTVCFDIPIDPSSRAKRRRARLLKGFAKKFFLLAIGLLRFSRGLLTNGQGASLSSLFFVEERFSSRSTRLCD